MNGSDSPALLTSPIALPWEELVPVPALFSHESTLHGQAHVGRVLVHAFRLIEATGWAEEAPRLWAAVYLHDLARTHDGVCHRHGADAMNRFDTMPAWRVLFSRGGVSDADYPAIRTAVIHHSVPREIDPAHPHWRLTSLLKDADGLDRVRLGDLDPRYLRHPTSRGMIGFAEALFLKTNGKIGTGRGHFASLRQEAIHLLRQP